MIAVEMPRDRCFVFQEAAEAANLRGDYGRAAILFSEAASCALTEDGRDVLTEKARQAEARARRDE